MQCVLNLYRSLRNGEKVLVLIAVVLPPLALVSAQLEQGNMVAFFSGISAFAAVAAAFGAWWAINAQNRRAQVTLSVNLTQQLGDKYESAAMKTTRKNAAAYILRVTTEDGEAIQHLIDADKRRDDLLEVLNLFDQLGTLVRSDAIDKHFVWNAFFPAVQMYWLGAEQVVEYWRKYTGRPLNLEDAEYLSKELTSYEQEQLARANLENNAHPFQQKVREFLHRETELLP